MKKSTVFACLLSLAAVPTFADDQAQVPPDQSDSASGQDTSALMGQIQDWSETSKKAAKKMVEKYGPPHETTASMWVWYDNGPWKRTIINKEPVNHEFPMPHKDVMEQVINYDAPVDKFDEIAAYDGSVILERTKAEMSARCDNEAANFLALNLAHEVASGQRSVEEARQFYADTIQAKMQGKSSPYLDGLLFDVAQQDLNNPDEPLIEMARK